MIDKRIVSNVSLAISLLAFISFAVYALYINQEVLYTAHERSEFLYGAPFFDSLLSKPFGLVQYVGAWLTQLFYQPLLGAGVLFFIWLLIFCVGVQAFRLQGSASALMLLPVACLLASTVDLGYWIYISPIRGYWFSQSVGYLVMLLLLWVARCTPRKYHLVWYLLGACIYPVLGWFALLFILCLVLNDKMSWRELAGLIFLLFTASIWHAQVYTALKSEDVMLAGFPRFETPLDSNEHLSIPFWVLGAMTVLISLCNRYLTHALVPVLCVVAGIGFTHSFMYQDQNYLNEMRMMNHASDDNWKEVLHIATKSSRPTTTMIFLKNIALMNEGGLLDRSFKLGNDGVAIKKADSLHVSLLNISAPLVYYNYGLMNESVRLSYENALQVGFSPFYLKLLARCARATGDVQLEKRYTTLLHHHPFYRDWEPAAVSKNVVELQHAYPDELTGVENSDSYIANSISLWYDSNSKLASEQALLYAMLRCDSGRFWASLRQYVRQHPNSNFPVSAQEAYIMYMDKSPEEKRMMLPVEQVVYDRYKLFWETLENLVKRGLKPEEIGARMRNQWKDTYWYYNIFGRKI